jgi:prepilin-type N-terminal cleavage/methylation domain-containing protein
LNPNKRTRLSKTPSTFSAGFSLIELLIVLAIIGAIAAAVLPNIGLTIGSQVSLSMRDFSTQVRTVFDSAILTGRIHRMVIDLKEGVYWSEAAPLGFVGRPPRPEAAAGESNADAEDRAKLLEELGTAVAEARPAGDSGTRNYSVRSILVNQRNVLKPTFWSEINDSVLFRKSLSGSVVFAALATELMSEKKSRSEFEGTEKG